jgi:hypothetical protein
MGERGGDSLPARRRTHTETQQRHNERGACRAEHGARCSTVRARVSSAAMSGSCALECSRGHSRARRLSPAAVGSMERQGTIAVASPTTLFSPSAFESVTDMSINVAPPSSRFPVTTILVDSTSSGQVWRAKRTW